MLTSRNSNFAGRLCRRLLRDFSVTTSSCTPRGSMEWSPSNTRPEQSKFNSISETTKYVQQTKLTAVSEKVIQTNPPADLSSIDLARPRAHHRKLLPEGSTEAEELYRMLVSASPEMVLELVAGQHERMNKVHYALAMKSLFRTALGLDDSELTQFRKDLQNQKAFQVLCALVALKGQHYEAAVAADMLRFMLVLGLDSHHNAVQVYLQLVKYHLNDLHLEVLIRLMYSLAPQQVTSQTEVIRQAIRVLVNLRADQIPTLNAWQCVTLLEQCASVLTQSTLHSLLAQLTENLHQISRHLATVILCALSRVDVKALSGSPVADSVAEMVTLCIQRLQQNQMQPQSSGGEPITKMAAEDILRVLEALSVLGVYDVDLFDEVGRRFSGGTEGCSSPLLWLPQQYGVNLLSRTEEALTDILRVLGYFHERRFHHAGLLAAFRARLGRREEEVFTDGQQVVTAVRVLADSSRPDETLCPDSRPTAERAAISEMCARLQQVVEYLTPEERQQCSVDMTVLRPTSDVVTSQPLMASLLRDLFMTTLSGSLPSEIREKHKEKTAIFGRALARAIDDQQSLRSEPEVPLSSVIDHMFFINSDGSLPSDQENLQINSLPDGVRPVAVLVLPDTCFHDNTGQLRGPALLCGRILQEAGYLVMMVNYLEWSRMPEPDMVPYLARRVRTVMLDQTLHMV